MASTIPSSLVAIRLCTLSPHRLKPSIEIMSIKFRNRIQLIETISLDPKILFKTHYRTVTNLCQSKPNYNSILSCIPLLSDFEAL